MTDTTTIVPDQTPDGENNAIPLKEAAKRFGFTLSTLRTEDRRGRLTTYRIGKKLFTRPSDIRRMVEKCRVVRKAHDFISITGIDAVRRELCVWVDRQTSARICSLGLRIADNLELDYPPAPILVSQIEQLAALVGRKAKM